MNKINYQNLKIVKKLNLEVKERLEYHKFIKILINRYLTETQIVEIMKINLI